MTKVAMVSTITAATTLIVMEREENQQQRQQLQQPASEDIFDTIKLYRNCQ